MAWNPVPTALFASWSENGTDITVPIASIPELTAAEADASSGDSRKVVFALLMRIHAWWSGLATADRPANLTVSRSIFENADGSFRYTFSVAFNVSPTAVEVVAES